MALTPPSEQDLHDYLDDRLDPAEKARVAAYLARHPEVAAELEAYRAQMAGFHALYDKVLDEPIPASMRALLRRQRSAGTWRIAALAAAAVALAMLSGAAGWWFNDLRHPGEAGPSGLVIEAQQAHRLFAGSDRWASDFANEGKAALVKSLSERLGAPVALPDIERAGLTLRGVRLVPTASGGAAVLIYRNAAGLPASLFIAPVDRADAPPRAVAKGELIILHRVIGGVGYALTLPVAAADGAVKIAFGMEPT
ncbi:MAG TPA: hypothetical protein VF502_11175 [Stellaceae bacterium]